jgi:hypothetical protein
MVVDLQARTLTFSKPGAVQAAVLRLPADDGAGFVPALGAYGNKIKLMSAAGPAALR